MGVFGKMRGMIPVSSRSVHAMWTDIVARIDAQELATYRYIDYKIDDLVVPRLEKVGGVLDAHSNESSNLLWQMYRSSGESVDEARRRYFRDMPQASGALRVLQMANVQLLAEFDKLCVKHDVRYFLTAGTLLGAIRHGGCIPWDDDIDVGITPGGLDKLQSVIRQDPRRYRITVVYDQVACCRQIRFRWADESPCFIDLFVYEYSPQITEDTARAYFQIRRDVIAKIKEMYQTREDVTRFLYESDSAYDEMRSVFDNAREKAMDAGLICRLGEDGTDNSDVISPEAATEDPHNALSEAVEEELERPHDEITAQADDISHAESAVKAPVETHDETTSAPLDGTQVKSEEKGLDDAPEGATALLWGLENVSWPDTVIPLSPLEWFIPLLKQDYEGRAFPVPNGSGHFLTDMYGDWMAMPKDYSVDVVHVRSDNLSVEKLLAMKSHI